MAYLELVDTPLVLKTKAPPVTEAEEYEDEEYENEPTEEEPDEEEVDSHKDASAA